MVVDFGTIEGDLINKPWIAFDINYNEKFILLRIYYHPDQMMSITLHGASAAKLAKILQPALEWK